MKKMTSNLKISWLLSILILIFSVNVSSGEEQQQSDILLPLGKYVDGNVEFDAIVSLNAPLLETKSVFFMHYYVSPDAISYDILWAEPVWDYLNFPCPPMGLSVYVDKTQYEHYHVWNEKRVKKDISGDSGVFQNTCNTYDLENAGFSYTNFLRRKLSTKDIKSLLDSAKSLLHEQELDSEGGNRENMYIRSASSEGNCTQFELNVRSPRRYFATSYIYSDDRLDRMVTEVPDRLIPVSGFSIEVKSNDMPEGYIVTQLPAKYHKGGRAFVVYFAETALNESRLHLPKNIEVSDRDATTPSDKRMLRNAQLSNYRLTSEPVRAADLGKKILSAPFFQDEQKFRQLSIKYWLQPSDSIPIEDKEWLEQFAGSCCERLKTEERLPYKLQLLYMLMASDLMCDHAVRFENSLQQYVKILEESGLKHIADIGVQQLRDLCNDWNKIALLHNFVP